MQDGLYKVQFKTPLGEGYGVVAMDGGRVRGGDSSMFYVGTYTQSGGDFSASINVDTHSNVPEMESVFGINKFSINLSGKSHGDNGVMNGTSPQAPGINFTATLTRIAD